MDWRVQNVSCVVFFSPGQTAPNAHDLWSHQFDSSPDSFQKQGAGSHANGAVAGYALSIASQPGKIEYTVGPEEDAEMPKGPKYLEDGSSGIDFTANLGKFASTKEIPLRVALVANCHIETETSAESVAVFREATRLHHIPDDSLDLTFGLNVRGKLTSARGEINRLCRWGVGQFQLFQITVEPSGIQTPHLVVLRESATMMVDVNSVSRGTLPMGSTQAANAFDDLASEVKRLILDGYDALVAPR